MILLHHHILQSSNRVYRAKSVRVPRKYMDRIPVGLSSLSLCVQMGQMWRLLHVQSVSGTLTLLVDDQRRVLRVIKSPNPSASTILDYKGTIHAIYSET